MQNIRNYDLRLEKFVTRKKKIADTCFDSRN